ncbi:MAG: hypothetical protein CMJ81_16290 [Planctomycetaceae bacterium]|nr:hypothetical protein [Planctomycetaceae bacterium]
MIDMANNRITTHGGFFRLLKIDAADTDRHSDAFEQVRRSDIHGIMLHGVYDAESMAAVNDCLVRHDPPFLRTSFPEEFRSWFDGRNLNLAPPDLDGYFEDAELFNALLESVFPPDRNWWPLKFSSSLQRLRGCPQDRRTSPSSAVC